VRDTSSGKNSPEREALFQGGKHDWLTADSPKEELLEKQEIVK